MSMDDNKERYEEETVSIVQDESDDHSQMGSVCDDLCFEGDDEISADEEPTLEDKAFIASDESSDSEEGEYVPCGDENDETEAETDSESDSDDHILDSDL